MKSYAAVRMWRGIAVGVTFGALLCATAIVARSQNTAPASAPPAASGPHGTVERVKVHGASLEGNLEGDPADRDVSVYLPPGYATHKKARYPVLYILHGYTDNHINWFGSKHAFVDAPKAIDAALADGSAKEMIIVMPSAYTVYMGSMYSNSVTTGNWEKFLTSDLVSYIDSHYRTIPDRMSRGLAGHSMGGYGTVRLGMKFPEVYSSIYAMSACCLIPNTDAGREDTPAFAQAAAKEEAIHTAADLASADFGTRADIASAAAWSPDPKNPPLYFDLLTTGGKVQPKVKAQWYANAPLAMLPQYIYNLKQLHAIAIDVGTQDGLMGNNQLLSERMTLFGIANTFETYDGNHISGIQDRLEKHVLPFFSNNLKFETK
jgi:S-formylglutathione hydrolase